MNKPCIRTDSFHMVCNFLNFRNCTECFEETTNTCCFLTNKTIFYRDNFVKMSCGKFTYTHLCKNKICALKSNFKVICGFKSRTVVIVVSITLFT